MTAHQSKSQKSWSKDELARLVYVLSTIEYYDIKINYSNAPAPPGRNKSGCAQKMAKVKKALRADIDAIKNGGPASEAKGKRKRKADSDLKVEKSRKRGRAGRIIKEESETEEEDSEEEV
ncbi:hypothetical protein N0V95_010131 [Ascochyta clinopodiicola]|nr:hypothetical protein N0V95_010131 [Ascochyta clinopodiicola]